MEQERLRAVLAERETDLERLARVFDALSDANRLRIVTLLAERELSGAELSETLGISPALACHHLKTLDEAGIVARRREGQVKYGILNRPRLREAFDAVLGDEPAIATVA